MKTQKLVYGIITTCLLSLSLAAVGADSANEPHRRVLMVEGAMELESLDISYNPQSKSGYVTGKTCDNCEKLRVKITPETRAIYQGDEVPLSHAGARRGRSADVFYDLETKEVTRIVW